MRVGDSERTELEEGSDSQFPTNQKLSHKKKEQLYKNKETKTPNCRIWKASIFYYFSSVSIFLSLFCSLCFV